MHHQGRTATYHTEATALTTSSERHPGPLSAVTNTWRRGVVTSRDGKPRYALAAPQLSLSPSHRYVPMLPSRRTQQALPRTAMSSPNPVEGRVSPWSVSLDRHCPARVLDAPGLVDDAYSQCLSWCQDSISVLLGDQLLLFDAANPSKFCCFRLPEDNGATLRSHRFSCVSVSSYSDDQVLAGDSRGALRFVSFADGASEGRVLFETSNVPEVDVLSPAPLLGDPGLHCIAEQQLSPLATLHAAALASNASALYDISVRSASSCDTTTAHPHLYLAGFASGIVALVDQRVGGIVSRTSPVGGCRSLTALSAPRSGGPGWQPMPSLSAGSIVPSIGDRIMSVSWNCSGSLFAAGTNSSGVFAWSMAKMSEPLGRLSAGLSAKVASTTRQNVAEPSSPHVSGAGEVDTSAAWTRQNSSFAAAPASQRVQPSASRRSGDAATRALQFHPTDPFELCYGGGVGSGVIRVCSVATGRVAYEVATGAQVTQVRYSPCGEHIVSSHGIRKSDIPRLVANNSQSHDDSSASHWGGAGSSGPFAKHKYCLAVWSRGRHRLTPGAVLAHDAAAEWASSDASWRQGMQVRSCSRDSVDISDDDDEVRNDDRPQGRVRWDAYNGDPFVDDGTPAESSPCRRQGRSGRDVTAQGTACPLKLCIRLDGHSSRPLHLACPKRGAHLGTVVSAAGGSDATIRSWCVFTDSGTCSPKHRTTPATVSPDVPCSTDQEGPSTEGGSREEEEFVQAASATGSRRSSPVCDSTLLFEAEPLR